MSATPVHPSTLDPAIREPDRGATLSTGCLEIIGDGERHGV